MTLIQFHNEPGTQIIIVRLYGRGRIGVRPVPTTHRGPSMRAARQLATSLNLSTTLWPQRAA